MPQATLKQLTVLDLVPFGNPGGQTAFYALRLASPDWEEWRPGQFVMLRPRESGPEILWGRPFSICRVTNSDLVLFFQVKGRATAALAKISPGDTLNVWGPLGNSFTMQAQTPTLLLAGGIGIAPFVGYVQNHPTPWDIIMEFGHRMPLECYPVDSINEKALMESHYEKKPEDRAAFLERVEQRIKEFAPNGLIIACGPTPFLREVQRFSAQHKARTQVSLETRMACGIGACLGCVVKAVPHGHKPLWDSSVQEFREGTDPLQQGIHVQTCTCGPNFWADSVSF